MTHRRVVSSRHGMRKADARVAMALVMTLQAIVATLATGAGAVARMDQALDGVVARNASLEVVLTGTVRDYFEGPTWVRSPSGGYLLFTNGPANLIYRWTPDGRLSVYLDHILDESGSVARAKRGRPLIGPNGSTLDRQGRLVYTSYSAGQIIRLEKNGERAVLASEFGAKRFNGLNDVVVKSDGSIYFTDSRKSLPQRAGKDCAQLWILCGDEKGIPHEGVYFLKDGVVHLFDRDVDHPNGLAFSPHEKYLYISNTLVRNILRFRMSPDGGGTGADVLVDMSGAAGDGAPDGIKVDTRGNVYCTGPGGIWIMAPSGKHIGTILTPHPATNFTFGGNDGKTLYIEEPTALYRISLRVAGLSSP